MADTLTMEVPVAIGATVYVPRAWDSCDQRVPCPVCYGQLYAVVILGNGEHVKVECEACGIGSLSGPTGYITASSAGSRVDAVTVTGLDWGGAAWRVRAGHDLLMWGIDAFATEAEAEVKREKLYAAAVIDAENRNGTVAGYARKKLTWIVRYHRDQLARARRDVATHERKLSDALARQRTAKSSTPSSPGSEP